MLEGVQDNVTLTDLNISANCASTAAAETLGTLIRSPEHRLISVDVSSNDMSAESLELLRISMSTNKTVTSLDIRRNPGYSEMSRINMDLERFVQINEFNARKFQQGPAGV